MLSVRDPFTHTHTHAHTQNSLYLSVFRARIILNQARKVKKELLLTFILLSHSISCLCSLSFSLPCPPFICLTCYSPCYLLPFFTPLSYPILSLILITRAFLSTFLSSYVAGTSIKNSVLTLVFYSFLPAIILSFKVMFSPFSSCWKRERARV